MKAATITGSMHLGGYRVDIEGEPSQRFLHLEEAIDAAGWRPQALRAFERLKAAQEWVDAQHTITLHSFSDQWRVSHPGNPRRLGPGQKLAEALVDLARHREAGMQVALSDRAAVDLAHHRLRPSDITQASAATLRNLAASLANGDNPHLRGSP